MTENEKENPFKVISSKIVYKNPWISVREDSVVRPGGGEGIFGVVDMVPGVSVLPLDDEGYVYLAKEYKYGVGKYGIEVFSGAVDKGETLLNAIKRELKEESGMTAHNWTDLGSVDPFTVVVNSPNHMFLARDLKKGDSNLEDGEEVKIIRKKFDEVLKMVLDGDITHSATCILILKTARLLGK